MNMVGCCCYHIEIQMFLRKVHFEHLQKGWNEEFPKVTQDILCPWNLAIFLS